MAIITSNSDWDLGLGEGICRELSAVVYCFASVILTRRASWCEGGLLVGCATYFFILPCTHSNSTFSVGRAQISSDGDGRLGVCVCVFSFKAPGSDATSTASARRACCDISGKIRRLRPFSTARPMSMLLEQSIVTR